MKNINSIKSVKTESPKTPGGISKSLLTPCRRVGLSRNWKKAGPSPFVSPLSGNASATAGVENKVEKKVSRKRKERVESEIDEEDQCTPETVKPNDDGLENDESDALQWSADKDDNLSSTPIRHIEVPRKKKSKKLLSSFSKTDQEKDSLCKKQAGNISHITIIPGVKVDDDLKENKQDLENPVKPVQTSNSKGVDAVPSIRTLILSNDNPKNDSLQTVEVKKDSNLKEIQMECITPVKKSRSKGKKGISQIIENSSPKSNQKCCKEDTKGIENLNSPKKQEKLKKETELLDKLKSPNELTKECIVVIQKKIFKTDKKQKDKMKSQTLFDSDSDDVPLGQLNKEKIDVLKQSPVPEMEKNQVEKPESSKTLEIINLVDEEEDFIETKRPKVKKLEDKSTSIGGLKKKPKNTKPKPQTQNLTHQTINTDFDDDEDDFEFDNKKTILIRKSYEKVNKPQRAKSTGSITQKDIDDLRARIEAKKKMLLARAMTEDTEELRSLIKKWQKGCQDALMELMELMKTKFADRQNLDYSEMLSMLKIPPNLVGYDADNDCFNTPDDATIILSKFNNE